MNASRKQAIESQLEAVETGKETDHKKALAFLKAAEAEVTEEIKSLQSLVARIYPVAVNMQMFPDWLGRQRARIAQEAEAERTNKFARRARKGKG